MSNKYALDMGEPGSAASNHPPDDVEGPLSLTLKFPSIVYLVLSFLLSIPLTYPTWSIINTSRIYKYQQQLSLDHLVAIIAAQDASSLLKEHLLPDSIHIAVFLT